MGKGMYGYRLVAEYTCSLWHHSRCSGLNANILCFDAKNKENV